MRSCAGIAVAALLSCAAMCGAASMDATPSARSLGDVISSHWRNAMVRTSHADMPTHTAVEHDTTPPPNGDALRSAPSARWSAFLSSVHEELRAMRAVDADVLRRWAAQRPAQHRSDATAAAFHLPPTAAQPVYVDNPVTAQLGHSYFPMNASEGYYALLPAFVAAAKPLQPVVWSTPCFTKVMAVASGISTSASGVSTLLLNITAVGRNASAPPNCSDFYLAATPDWLDVVYITAPNSISVSVVVKSSAWVLREGVRIFQFMHDPITTLGDAISTVSLFVPSLTEAVLDAASQQRNLRFLEEYVGITMEARASAAPLDMDWSYMKSGDMLAIHRLDGLGTLEEWGTGAASTHIASILRLGSQGRPYVVESTAADA
ncbi:MAG: hypothetical protein EOO41_02165 [Methanobacteriota archaeon]|nr:MAG: hypothetical protein EOO41_02165 [Euryarchaeota archaeon]